MLRQDKAEEEELAQETEKKQKELDDKEFMAKDYDRNKRTAIRKLPEYPTSGKLLQDPKNISEFKETIQISLAGIEDRNKYVAGLYEAVKGLMTNKQANQAVQTDEACMNNAVMYQYCSDGEASSEEVEEEKKEEKEDPDSPDAKLKRLMQAKGLRVEEPEAPEPALVKGAGRKAADDEDEGDSEIDTVGELKFGGVKGLELSKNKDVRASQSSLPSHSQSRTGKKRKSHLSLAGESQQKQSTESRQGGDHKSRSRLGGGNKSADKRSDFNILEAPQAYHTTTMRQMGLQNEKKLRFLHDAFEKQCMKIKKRKMLQNNDDPAKLSRKDAWRIPYRIIAFIQNRIFQLEEDPNLVENYELMPWVQLKAVMFEVYDHRIKHAPELNGSANANYCTMNEHLLMFFVDEYRRRPKAEEKIADLLINLRYYHDHWQRARIFAANLQLLQQPSEAAKLKQQEAGEQSDEEDEYGDRKYFEPPHAHLRDQELTENDVFAQEFYLHAYSLLCSERANFVESREGGTYVRTKHHDAAAKKIFAMIRGPCGDLQKWNLKIRRQIVKIPNKDGSEGDYLDLDSILGMMLDEYKSQRRLFQKDLQKQFLRQLESNVGPLDLDAYEDVIAQGLPPDDDNHAEDPLMQFPGKISRVRAFIFSCVSSDSNTHTLTDDQFLAGCWRFAVENPVASVSTRCALYGNSRDVMQQLADAEKEYGKPNMKVDSRKYTSATMGLPEKKDFKARKTAVARRGAAGEERSDEDELEARRKPTVEAHETPRPTLPAAN